MQPKRFRSLAQFFVGISAVVVSVTACTVQKETWVLASAESSTLPGTSNAPAGGQKLVVSGPKLHANKELDHLFWSTKSAGQNVSPEINWTPIKGAQSYTLTFIDVDTGQGNEYKHWVVSNIPAQVHSLKRNASAEGLPAPAVQLPNTFNVPAYIGPSPQGSVITHHYVLTVYAVKNKTVDTSSTKAAIDDATKNSLAKGVITVTASQG